MTAKKIFKRVLVVIVSLIVIVAIAGLILAFLPTKSKTNHIGISGEQAALYGAARSVQNF